jgi:uncharacterized membrane protein YfcA
LTILAFSGLLLAASFFAGLLGALTGLGGGVIIIAVLVLGFRINIHYAMGASLISVIATSSGTAAAYLREGYTNLRIGMFLETAAVIGAFIGALLIAYVSKTFLAGIFSLLLFYSAYLTIKPKKRHIDKPVSHPWAIALKLDGSYPHKKEKIHYHVQNVPLALSIMGIAGLLAGLLGIGSGALKVLAMDQALQLPYKVATTTSNFIIGITAAASVGTYFSHGYINPVIAFPVMIGVVIGAFMGARLLPKIHTQILRILVSSVIFFMGMEMLYKTMTGTL